MTLKRSALLSLAALGITAAVATPAQASRLAPVNEASALPVAAASSTSAPTPTGSGEPSYYSAKLSGANEISPTGAPGAGDPRGSAKAIVEIDGDQVIFAFTWKGITAPVAGHIHVGAAGVNGDVKVPLIMSAMPDTSTGTAGAATVSDAALLDGIRADPAGFYVNLHTAAFPAGAVRGQLVPLKRATDPLSLIGGLPLQAAMSGAQEVPPGAPSGSGTGLIRASGTHVDYAFAWSGISEPIMGHIHSGAPGVSGPIVVPLIMSPVPDGIFALSGEVSGVAKTLATDIRTHPVGYYVNLHTTEYPAGAIRGQLFPAGHLSLP